MFVVYREKLCDLVISEILISVDRISISTTVANLEGWEGYKFNLGAG